MRDSALYRGRGAGATKARPSRKNLAKVYRTVTRCANQPEMDDPDRRCGPAQRIVSTNDRNPGCLACGNNGSIKGMKTRLFINKLALAG